MKIAFTILSFLLSLISLSSYAQTSETISANNIEAQFTANGGLFQDEHYWGKFIIKNANRSAIFAGSTWISGKVNGQLRAALQDYFLLNDTSGFPLNGSDFSAGPVADSYTSSAYQNKYNKVWKIARHEIEYHKKNYNKATYIPTAGIINWPTHGDTSNGEAPNLAPFFDANGNNLYNPYDGDYPIIRGDVALYIIYNDDQQLSSLSTTASMGIELHMMIYAYDSVSFPALHNTLFTHLQIHNRSSAAIDSLIVSNWLDVDLGNHLDDIFGSDSIRQLAYFYNADQNDEGPAGFGLNPPAVGILNLQNNARGNIYYNQNGSAFFPIETTEPQSPVEFRRYMNQKWRNGNSIIQEAPYGDGYVSSDSGTVTRWAGHGWIPSGFGDFQNVFSTYPVALPAGDEICFDFAYIYARNTDTNDLFASVNKLIGYTDQVQNFFDTEITASCIENATISLGELQPGLNLKLYPNPTQGNFVIDFSTIQKSVTIEVLNSRGQLISQSTHNSTEQVNVELKGSAGIYLVKVTTADNIPAIFKIVKEN